MSDVNKILITGCVGQNPIIRPFNKNPSSSFASFSVACNKFKQKAGEFVQHTTWFNIFVLNEQQVKKCENIKQGDKLFIVGRMEQSVRLNPNTNQNMRSFSVIIDNYGSIDILRKPSSDKKDNLQFNNTHMSDKPNSASANSNEDLDNNMKNNHANNDIDDDLEELDDEIPF